jgi:hypothetical protein
VDDAGGGSGADDGTGAGMGALRRGTGGR